jgi:hypothetical protein
MIAASGILRICFANPCPYRGSLNRCVSGFAYASPKFLAMLGTSDTRKLLSEIPNPALEVN